MVRVQYFKTGVRSMPSKKSVINVCDQVIRDATEMLNNAIQIKSDLRIGVTVDMVGKELSNIESAAASSRWLTSEISKKLDRVSV
jgi:hypothetical protein